MNDICIKLITKSSNRFNVFAQLTEIAAYKDWIRKNYKKNTFYIPNGPEPIVFFLSEEDLVIFTLQFGRECYEILGTNVIEMSKVTKMIWNEIIEEKFNEKSNN